MLARVTQVAAGVLCALVVAAALALGTLAIVTKSHETTIACQQVNVLRVAIVRILQQGEADLPHNSYLKLHPDQLRTALRDYAVDISRLQPVAC